MSEMIERVAEAIAISGNGGTWDDWYNQDQKEFHRKRARAAIEAMREPTDGMVDNCYCNTTFSGGDEQSTVEYVADENKKDFWRDMIDAALAKIGA